MDEDDDAFLYGESSPPPAAAPEIAQTPEVTTSAKPDVTPTRSSFLYDECQSDIPAAAVSTPASGLSAAMAA